MMSQGPILPFVPEAKAASGGGGKKGFPHLLLREPDTRSGLPVSGEVGLCLMSQSPPTAGQVCEKTADLNEPA